MRSESLHRVIAVLMLAIAVVLLLARCERSAGKPLLQGALLVVAGIAGGFGIGIVASLLGVAGGEPLIPTLVLLFGADIKLAASLSLAVSLPTMLVGFVRYSRDRSFIVLRRHRRFVLVIAAGAGAGAFVGGQLIGLIPSAVLLPVLALILLVLAVDRRLAARCACLRTGEVEQPISHRKLTTLINSRQFCLTGMPRSAA